MAAPLNFSWRSICIYYVVYVPTILQVLSLSLAIINNRLANPRVNSSIFMRARVAITRPLRFMRKDKCPRSGALIYSLIWCCRGQKYPEDTCTKSHWLSLSYLLVSVFMLKVFVASSFQFQIWMVWVVRTHYVGKIVTTRTRFWPSVTRWHNSVTILYGFWSQLIKVTNKLNAYVAHKSWTNFIKMSPYL